jgi:hypothetical protein
MLWLFSKQFSLSSLSSSQPADYHAQRMESTKHIATFAEVLKDCTDPASRAILAEGMAHAQQQIEHISIQEATAAARASAAPVAPSAPPFSQHQHGYSSDDGERSPSRYPQRTSPSKPSPSVSVGVFVRASKRPVRTAPPVLTASVLALIAYIGGATVPQLVPGSYSVKKVPFLQTESAPPPAPPAGAKWQSIVVDSGCSVSVFDSPDKFAALYPSKTYLQTADKSERIFDSRSTVVLPTVNATGEYQPLVIKHAICAPGIHNLLSVSDVVDSYPAGQVVFNKKNSYIEIEPGMRVPITRTGKLFYLTPASAPQSHGHRFEAFMNEEIVPADRPTDIGFPSSSPPVVDKTRGSHYYPGHRVPRT